jgi:LexA-binding, inner membrane-associated putative hydrolase
MRSVPAWVRLSMTTYEHAMFGANLALVAGVRRRHGWGLVATAAVAAALPDWDGLSFVFGPGAFASVHRVWGHNLLAAGLGGALVGVVGLLAARSVRVRSPLTHPPAALPAPPPAGSGTPAIWAAVGMLAGLSHLPADIVFNGGAGLSAWPVPLLWPFSRQGWAVPIVPWGDIAVTVLFVGEMFALYRWPRHDRAIAALTLAAGSAYLLIRWLLAGFIG